MRRSGVLTRITERDPNPQILSSLYWLYIIPRIEIKILLLAYRTIMFHHILNTSKFNIITVKSVTLRLEGNLWFPEFLNVEWEAGLSVTRPLSQVPSLDSLTSRSRSEVFQKKSCKLNSKRMSPRIFKLIPSNISIFKNCVQTDYSCLSHAGLKCNRVAP